MSNNQRQGHIPAHRRELIQAFRDHFSACELIQATTNSYLLLLFYAVECGLKALLIEKTNVYDQSTAGLQAHVSIGGKEGHNVQALLGNLVNSGYHFRNVPPRVSFKELTTTSRNSQEEKRNVHAREYNQLWRYGIEVEDTSKQDEAKAALYQVAKWIEREV